MTTANDARRAHKIIEDIIEGYEPTLNDMETLRSFLPELPAQKTLQQIIAHVDDAWSVASDSDWGGNSYDPDVSIEDWLTELHEQLKGLIGTPATVPALPAGMRLADHEDFGRVIVSPKSQNGDYIIFAVVAEDKTGADWFFATDDQLTFLDADSGAEPTHPEFLETEADYENAPEGTIVARSGQVPWVKESGKQWSCIAGAVANCSMSKNKPRRILRWGWGK